MVEDFFFLLPSSQRLQSRPQPASHLNTLLARFLLPFSVHLQRIKRSNARHHPHARLERRRYPLRGGSYHGGPHRRVRPSVRPSKAPCRPIPVYGMYLTNVGTIRLGRVVDDAAAPGRNPRDGVRRLDRLGGPGPYTSYVDVQRVHSCAGQP